MTQMSNGIMLNQRDIVLIPFPFSDLTGSKMRPSLIISNNNLKDNDLICMLISSVYRNGDCEIKKSDLENGKLKFVSYIRPHRVFSAHSKTIAKKLARIKINLFKHIMQEFNFFVSC